MYSLDVKYSNLSFNKILQEEMHHFGETTVSLSKKLGLPYFTVKRWQEGSSFPSYPLLKSLKKCLGLCRGDIELAGIITASRLFLGLDTLAIEEQLNLPRGVLFCWEHSITVPTSEMFFELKKIFKYIENPMLWVCFNRVVQGLSRTELANKLGTIEVSVRSWESNERKFSSRSLLKLQRVFNNRQKDFAVGQIWDNIEKRLYSEEDNLRIERPRTTLFMLMSVDGKISTGAYSDLDFDKDLPRINGIREGLKQYYAIEQTTDLWSINSGKTLNKIGVNKKENPVKTEVNFVVIDNNNLTEQGIKYMCDKSKRFILFTTNAEHPAFKLQYSNMEVFLSEHLNLTELLITLRRNYGCEGVTIQTGGTLNALFLRNKLIDYIDVVAAPVLVGGHNTPTLIDGNSIASDKALNDLGVLQLISCDVLEKSYLRLKYKVINK